VHLLVIYKHKTKMRGMKIKKIEFSVILGKVKIIKLVSIFLLHCALESL
jgi:hypothetical protein